MEHTSTSPGLRDVLGRDVRCDHHLELAVMGIPMRIESNHPTVVAVASEAFGHWVGSGEPDLARSAPPVTVRIVVDPAIDYAGDRALVYRMLDPDRLLITGPGVAAVADASRWNGVAHVSRTLVSDAEHFRYAVLEALTLFNISLRDRQPIHAAAVANDDRLMLLAGPAGVGKSTLAYACLQAGMTLVAEDMVWVELRDRFAVWGRVARVHVPHPSVKFFPELKGRAATVLAGGEQKIVVPVPESSRAARARFTAAEVCVLRRGVQAGAGRASPAAVAEAIAPKESGFDMFKDTVLPAVDRLSAGGGWYLTLSPNPVEAVPILAGLLAGGNNALR